MPGRNPANLLRRYYLHAASALLHVAFAILHPASAVVHIAFAILQTAFAHLHGVSVSLQAASAPLHAAFVILQTASAVLHVDSAFCGLLLSSYTLLFSAYRLCLSDWMIFLSVSFYFTPAKCWNLDSFLTKLIFFNLKTSCYDPTSN